MKTVALPEFLRRAKRLLTNAELAAFVDYISAKPEGGKVVPGLKGVRKIRWGRGAVGKRGGVRILYLQVVAKRTLYLLTIYSKSERADLTGEQKQLIGQLVATIKGDGAHDQET